MKTAIYIRVSTEEQAKEGYSIKGQLKSLKAYCLSQTWEVEGIYADEGISAKDMERPELKRMMKDIEGGKIECVLVYRLDRLTRSVFDLYKILETFEKYDCKFKSATEVYDTTTAMGRMFITIVAALAQWERENMGERIAFGFAEKARQGKYPSNLEPIGYNLNREESKLYINEKEAITVRKVFDLYLSGLGSNRMIRYLNDNGYRSKRGSLWSSDTIFKVLGSPVHAGGTIWNGVIKWDTHEPIVSKEDWEEVQRLRKERRTQSARSVSSPYIFSRMLECPNCGYNLVGTNSTYRRVDGDKTIYYYYICKKHKENQCSFNYSISAKKVEGAFLRYLTAFDFNSVIKSISKDDIVNDNVTIDIDNLKAELVKIDELKKKWQYAWAEDIISNEDFKKRMNEANEDESKINVELEKYQTEEKTFDIEQIQLALNDIKNNWSKIEPLEKKSLVNSIIDTIYIDRIGKDVIIHDISFL